MVPQPLATDIFPKLFQAYIDGYTNIEQDVGADAADQAPACNVFYFFTIHPFCEKEERIDCNENGYLVDELHLICMWAHEWTFTSDEGDDVNR